VKGDFEMQRLALGLMATNVAFFAFALAIVLPIRAMAFDMETGTVTAPGGSTQFEDPDEKPLPAPLTLPKLEGNGTTSMVSGTDLQPTPGTGLQVAPGLSLQITGGSGPYIPGLQPGLQMAPMMDHNNPADDRSLIPAP
jgi:hypothetical protein